MVNIDESVTRTGEDGLGLAGLSGLVAGSASVTHLLTEVANFAMAAVPGADGAGVTMLEAGHGDTIVASAPFVRDVDAIQYRLGEGPGISAAADGRTTGSGALGEDVSWPTFGPLAAALGIHSALSLPLVLNLEVIGTLNVYAHGRNAFDGSSRRVGESLAGPAAVAIHNARVLDQAQRAIARLESALTTRSTIDHAIGIVMARCGLSADDAYLRLRITSRHENVKVSEVAARLVEVAVGRAAERTPLPAVHQGTAASSTGRSRGHAVLRNPADSASKASSRYVVRSVSPRRTQ